MKRLLSVVFAGACALSLATVIQGCVETKCGPGTTKEGDNCVPLCGDGEYWDAANKACLPVVECAEGTELNRLTGKCEPKISECADGTELVNGECVPECIDGQEYFNGVSCQPIPDCASGTIFNQNTNECVPVIDDCSTGTHLEGGSCVPDVICGAGTHAAGGECLPDTLGEPDVVEGDENNDIFFPNWTATIVNLPAVDDDVTLGGNVRAPTDLDGDGIPDADFDAFILVPDSGAGMAGSYLHIEATSESVCNPALMIVGVDENSWELFYYRYALNPNGATAARDVFLPGDGIYFVMVTDYTNLVSDAFGLDAIPVGGDDFTYFVTIENRTPPAATGISGFPYAGSGSHADGSLQFFDLPELMTDDILRVSTTSAPSDVMPIAMLFAPDGSLAKELVIPSTAEEIDLNYYVENGGNFVLVMDYLMTIGPASDYSLEAALRQVIDMSSQASPWDGQLDAGDSLLLQFDLTEGDIFPSSVEPPMGSRVNLELALFDNSLDLLYQVDSGSCGDPEDAYFYAQKDERLFVEVSEADGKQTPFTLDFTAIHTPELQAGNSYHGLPVNDMPANTLPDSAIERFTADFGQLISFTNFQTSGIWWINPLEQIYTPFVNLMGPMVDATDPNFASITPLMAFVPAAGQYLHMVWDPNADQADDPSGANYDTDFYAQDTTFLDQIAPGVTVTKTQQLIDTTSGFEGFSLLADAAQPVVVTVTPDGADFQPEIWLLIFGSREGDYWASDPESFHMGKVAAAVAEAAGEPVELSFVSPYAYLSLVLIRDAAGNQSPGTFSIQVAGPAVPANDTCQGAESITLTGGSAEIYASTMGAASDIDQVACLPAEYPPYGPEVIYSIDLQAGQNLSATFSGSFDGAIYLLDDCACPNCGCVTGSDSAYIPPDEDENIGYTVLDGAGGTYYIVIDSWSPYATGDFTLTVTVN